MSKARKPSNQSMEVLEGGTISESDPASSKRTPSAIHRSKPKRPDSAASLEILPPEQEKLSIRLKDNGPKISKNSSRPSSSKSNKSDVSRPSSSDNHRRAPPIARPDSAPRRTPTPTKQVALQAVRRKKDETNWNEKENTHPSNNEAPKPYTTKLFSRSSSTTSCGTSSSDISSSTLVSNSVASESTGEILAVSDDIVEGAVGGMAKGSVSNQTGPDLEDSDAFDTDLEDGEEKSSDDEEEEAQKAPNELFMEFLSCVMDHDYENAQKLCQMILMYEPDHAEALNFQALIEEKMKLDEENSGSDETDTDDDDDDSEGDSDESSDGDSSGSDDSSDEGESTDGGEGVPPTDSGVSSSTEM